MTKAQNQKYREIFRWLADPFVGRFSSACLTSIIRTYYRWKVVTSPDVSYNMNVMGIWTYAEIAIGIIISCTPVLPIFCKKFGSKVSGPISFRSRWSRSGGVMQKIPQLAEIVREPRSPPPIRRRSGGRRDTQMMPSNDPYISPNRLEANEYIGTGCN